MSQDTRQGSISSLEPECSKTDQDEHAFVPLIVPDEDVSMLVAERHMLDGNVRVTYQDPAQNDEKLRIMRLLETQRPREIWEIDTASDSVSVEGTGSRRKKPPARRSTRLSGF